MSDNPALANAPIRFSLMFSGLWAMHVWIAWSSNILDGYDSLWWLSHSVSLIAVIIVFTIAYWNRERSFGSLGFLDGPFTCVMTLGTLMASSPVLLGWDNAAVVAAGILLGGAGVGWFFLRWGVLFCALDLENAIVAILGGYIISSFAKAILGYVPAGAFALTSVLLPVVSATMLRASFGLLRCPVPLEGAVLYAHGDMRAVWKIAGYTAVFTLFIIFAKYLGGSMRYTSLVAFPHMAEIAVALILMAWLLLLRRRFDVFGLWAVVMVLVLFALLLAVLGVRSGSQTLGALLVDQTIANSSIIMISWIVFADISHHSQMHPFVTFGICSLSYALPKQLMAWAFPAVAASLDVSAAAAVLMFALSVLSLALLNRRDPDLLGIFRDLDDRPANLEDAPSLHERCAIIAGEYGLTTRETEVMEYLCQGRSKAYIAETLYLSENTIRGHARCLYTKCGVHSRDDLQRLVDRAGVE